MHARTSECARDHSVQLRVVTSQPPGRVSVACRTAGTSRTSLVLPHAADPEICAKGCHARYIPTIGTVSACSVSLHAQRSTSILITYNYSTLSYPSTSRCVLICIIHVDLPALREHSRRALDSTRLHVRDGSVTTNCQVRMSLGC